MTTRFFTSFELCKIFLKLDWNSDGCVIHHVKNEIGTLNQLKFSGKGNAEITSKNSPVLFMPNMTERLIIGRDLFNASDVNEGLSDSILKGYFTVLNYFFHYFNIIKYI